MFLRICKSYSSILSLKYFNWLIDFNGFLFKQFWLSVNWVVVSFLSSQYLSLFVLSGLSIDIKIYRYDFARFGLWIR